MAVMNFGAGTNRAPLTLDERIAQINQMRQDNANRVNIQAQPSAGLGVPESFILRNLESNPFVQRIEVDTEESSVLTHKTILTNTSSEAQTFLGDTSVIAESISEKIIKFASDMFALDVGVGRADDFIKDNLPPDLEYTGFIDSIVPKLEKALVKRLAMDIGIDLLNCPEIPDFNSGGNKNANLIQRILDVAAKDKGES